jgi:hypothetical protein
VADGFDVQQFVQYLPVEAAAEAIRDLKAQGLKNEAQELEKALKQKTDSLAKAKAEAEAAEEAKRLAALADLRAQFDDAVAAFVVRRDAALDALADYLDLAQKAINDGNSFSPLYSQMYSLSKDGDPDLPEMPESAMQIVQKDERFKGRFAAHGGIPGGPANL